MDEFVTTTIDNSLAAAVAGREAELNLEGLARG